jgi:hypothetical protein
MSFAEEISLLLEMHQAALQVYADRILKEVVIPFCDKHDLKFYVSWGDYRFRRLDDSEDEDCWQDCIEGTIHYDGAPVRANADAPDGYQDVLDVLFIPTGDGSFIYQFLEGQHYRFHKEAS